MHLRGRKDVDRWIRQERTETLQIPMARVLYLYLKVRYPIDVGDDVGGASSWQSLPAPPSTKYNQNILVWRHRHASHWPCYFLPEIAAMDPQETGVEEYVRYP